jgi:hypothetical protein
MQFTALVPNAVGYSYRHIIANTIREARSQLRTEGIIDKTIRILPTKQLTEIFEMAETEAKKLEARGGFPTFNIIAF